MKIKLCSLLITLLFLIGCGGSTGGPDITYDLKRFHSGTEGLTLEFPKNMPPSEVYEDSLFPLSVEMKNKGATDIREGYLAVGIEQDYMELIYGSEIETFDLDGKKLSTPMGDQEIYEYQIMAKKIDAQSFEHTSTIMVSGCYRYRTETSEQVCIDTDIYNQKYIDKACEVEDLSLSSQGGPVAITKIEAKMLPHDSEDLVKPEFIIHIENKGNGEVIQQNRVEEMCRSSSIDRSSFNVIYINAYLTESQRLNCKPKIDPDSTDKEGYIRLRSKKDFVRCVLDEGIRKNEPPYFGLLTILMDYGYTFTVSRNVVIKNEIEY